jgi:F0F1-type ATP synthase membrane subunit b/b'
MDVWKLILIQIAAFAGLILVLRFLFYRQLNAALRRLQALHEQALEKESQLEEELKRAKEERAVEVERGREEAQVFLETAAEDAEILKSNAQERATLESRQTLARGQQELERLRTKMKSEIEDEAVRFSIEIIRHTFTQDGRQALQHQMIEELIQEIEGLKKEQFSIKTTTVSVVSSLPLSDSERMKLRKILGQKLDRSVSLEESVDPKLITGLKLQMGALVIDGSLQNKLKHAIPLLSERDKPKTREKGD